jgi:hypothetical protein
LVCTENEEDAITITPDGDTFILRLKVINPKYKETGEEIN